jgi:hypothetical protein
MFTAVSACVRACVCVRVCVHVCGQGLANGRVVVANMIWP